MAQVNELARRRAKATTIPGPPEQKKERGPIPNETGGSMPAGSGGPGSGTRRSLNAAQGSGRCPHVPQASLSGGQPAEGAANLDPTTSDELWVIIELYATRHAGFSAPRTTTWQQAMHKADLQLCVLHRALLRQGTDVEERLQALLEPIAHRRMLDSLGDGVVLSEVLAVVEGQHDDGWAGTLTQLRRFVDLTASTAAVMAARVNYGLKGWHHSY